MENLLEGSKTSSESSKPDPGKQKTAAHYPKRPPAIEIACHRSPEIIKTQSTGALRTLHYRTQPSRTAETN